MHEEFVNEHPGEDICPFCNQEIELLDKRDIAAEDDGAFWVDRKCRKCDRSWRDYYDPEGPFDEVCDSCDSMTYLEVESPEINGAEGRSESVCNNCGHTWTNYYKYARSLTL